MKVKELIEELKKYPDDAEVYKALGYDFGGNPDIVVVDETEFMRRDDAVRLDEYIRSDIIVIH